MGLGTRILSAAAVLAFAILAGGGQGAVLCLGADGHVAVEPGPCASDSDCSEASPTDGVGCTSAECGPCTDVPLMASATAAERVAFPEAPSPTSALSFDAAATVAPPAAVHSVYEFPPHPNPILASISTRVLLI